MKKEMKKEIRSLTFFTGCCCLAVPGGIRLLWIDRRGWRKKFVQETGFGTLQG